MNGSSLCGTVAFEAEPPAAGLRIGFCCCPYCHPGAPGIVSHRGEPTS